jgi:FKBP-type peptidyl-prolyl cis-trans isomerase FkpA
MDSMTRRMRFFVEAQKTFWTQCPSHVKCFLPLQRRRSGNLAARPRASQHAMEISMKLTSFSSLAAGLFLGLTGVAHAQITPLPSGINMAAPQPGAPDRQELSMALGTFLARYDTNYVENSLGMDLRADFDRSKVLEGFSNFLADPDKSMPWMQVTNILNRQIAYLKDKSIVDSNAMIAAGPENKAKGIKFLEDNAAKPGVTRLTNGIEYKVLKEGDGVLPGPTDMVTLNLTATLIDGTEVGAMTHRDVSMANLRGLPPAVPPMLGTMKAGSHWIIYVPYELAYGDKPAIPSALRAPRVPPYSVMVFDVELEAVHPPPAPTAPPPGAMPNMPPMQNGSPIPRPAANTPTLPNGMPIPRPPAIPDAPVMHPPPGPIQAQSDILRVPSLDERKRGSNIETMTLDQAIKSSQTNTAVTNKQ